MTMGLEAIVILSGEQFSKLKASAFGIDTSSVREAARL